MNLCRDPWLVFRTSQNERVVLPISELGRDNLVDAVLPRQDFYGATWQFLIGLLQTAMAPEDDEEWLDLYESPPDSETLGKALAPIEYAFELFGDGPRFMQDLAPLQDGTEVGISSLLIDAPGGNTLKLNTDHFIKRGMVNHLSPAMAAMALFTLQINAPSGGQGHRTGLRGGGPLSTLVVPNKAATSTQDSNQPISLFRKLWLNVVPVSPLLPRFDPASPESVFPWLKPTTTSEKKGSEIYLNDEGVHPLQQYWAMPRRIRLVESGEGVCDLSGAEESVVVGHYRTRNYGNNYEGTWQHPLTPYRFDPKDPASVHTSIKGQPGGIGYRQWHQFLYRNEQEGTIAALVVREISEKEEWLEDLGMAGRLSVWVFGFDMDNMKARSWYEARMPYLMLEDAEEETFVSEIVSHIEVAKKTASLLRKAIKEAWSSGDLSGDLGFVDDAFWSSTEHAFYELANDLNQSVRSGKESATPGACSQWINALKSASVDLFDQLVLSDDSPDSHLRRKLDARRMLKNMKFKSDYLKRHLLNSKGKVAS